MTGEELVELYKRAEKILANAIERDRQKYEAAQKKSEELLYSNLKKERAKI